MDLAVKQSNQRAYIYFYTVDLTGSGQNLDKSEFENPSVVRGEKSRKTTTSLVI